jgi:O-antigen ligase
MKKFQDYVDVGFLIATLIIPFIPNFGRLDIVGPQYLFLSALLFIFITFKLFSSEAFKFRINYSIIFFLLFLIMAFLSMFNSFNLIESIIEVNKHFVTFFFLVITFSIFNINKNYIHTATLTLVGFLFVETSYILNIFIENYSFENPPSRLREFQGLAYNQNIASNSIMCKIPLTLYFLFKAKSKTYEYLLLTLLAISIFVLLIIGSRSTIYSTYLLLFSLIGFFIFSKKQNFLDLNRKLLLKPILIILSVFIFQNILYRNSTSNLQAVNRSLQLDDYSTNYRLKLWESSLEMLMDYPILGVGIGNWKIMSIKYGKENINQYEVPKHAHNDFFQIMAEAGILGGLFYMLFFISPFYFVITKFKSISTERKRFTILLTFSLVFIGVDYFFNFPRIRPYSLLNLFWVFAFIYNVNTIENE